MYIGYKNWLSVRCMYDTNNLKYTAVNIQELKNL